jgi:hypothetical protein
VVYHCERCLVGLWLQQSAVPAKQPHDTVPSRCCLAVQTCTLHNCVDCCLRLARHNVAGRRRSWIRVNVTMAVKQQLLGAP